MASWNIFRYAADFSHAISLILLLYKLQKHKSVEGISLKTQLLYLIVFCCRYVDIFWNYKLMYNNIFKIFYVSITAYLCYLIGIKYKSTYQKDQDRFKLWWAIVPSVILGIIFNSNHKKPFEYIYAFTLFLESVAILPQLIMLIEQEEIENLTGEYIFFLGLYRALYILNWIYRFFTEKNYRAWVTWVCGLIQTALYSDYIYQFFKAKTKGRKLSLQVDVEDDPSSS
ncbi:putative ER lumen protein-retaining receptor [Blattamonas nauphoetae]|uniref:ER lumen protein-retaining receptor n=1 Tax=Blattamonas nauphoetae TaxID=2049346 RepID=A0ABQ9XX99_9EUKA|nr:putative ER lumen protein-retaining receptor [Blattamonas nauphoetae]